MNEPLPTELLERLERMPKDPIRSSRLEPYRDVILRWRRQGRSYRTILRILASECNVAVSFGTLHEFVQRRSRPRKQGEPELVTHNETPVAATPYDEIVDHGHSSGKTRAEMLAFLAQEKAKPLAPKPVTEKLFEYTDEDASKPIKTLSEGEPI